MTQNPFQVVGFVKPGLLRLVTIRVVMSAIDYAVRHVYNHASLAGIATIHFARWVPLDGWRRMTFASRLRPGRGRRARNRAVLHLPGGQPRPAIRIHSAHVALEQSSRLTAGTRKRTR